MPFRTGSLAFAVPLAASSALLTGVAPPGPPAPEPAPAVVLERGLAWPVRPPSVVERFRIGPERWSPGHRGVDLAAAAGRVVLAPAGGVVSFAGVVAGRPVLSIDHGGGLVSSLEPVLPGVRRGEAVSGGTAVGTLGPSPGHCWPSACLHWGVRLHGRYIDPASLAGRPPGPIRLLPLGATGSG